MKERIQPKWFAGLHTKATEVLAPASVVNLMITQLMLKKMSQKQKMKMKQEKNR